jgi:hypothetical protein
MEAMLGFSLYSYPYLNFLKCFVFLITAYVYSSTKLETRTGSAWKQGGWGEVGGGRGEK